MKLPFLTRWRANDGARAGVPEAKASRTASVIAFQSAGRPVWSGRDYAALAREGFAKNAVAYRSVRMIAEAVASLPWLLYEGDAELTEHPLLALLKRPNRRQADAEFREALVGHLLVSGNAYVEAVTLPGANGRAEVRELHVLRPDRMKVVPGGDGWPEAYEYSAGGRTVRFADGGAGAGVGEGAGGSLPPILHLALFHPLDDHYGFAPIEAAGNALDIHNAAGAWNKALLDNSARPSGALVYQAKDGGNLSAEQYERLKAELSEGFTGAARAGRPLLLEGGLDWRAMSLSPKDMDFMEAKNAAAREIALAFGVPPMLCGIPGDNTYANYREANAAFWRATVLPLAAKVAGALGGWLGPAFGGEAARLRLWFDADQVEALAGDREALWSRIAAADFLTVDEKRAAVGYGAAEVDALAGKAGFDPNQPRVPKDNPRGGQWAKPGTGGSQIADLDRILGDLPPSPLVEEAVRNLGIPDERPRRNRDRLGHARQLARLLRRLSPAARVVDALELAGWVHEYLPVVVSYLDEPRSLAELQGAVRFPRPGYDIHHIVERSAASQPGFPVHMLNAPENLVLIPTFRHWELNAWYEQKNENYGGISPRHYLKGKDWTERFRVGEIGLGAVGVLVQ